MRRFSAVRALPPSPICTHSREQRLSTVTERGRGAARGDEGKGPHAETVVARTYSIDGKEAPIAMEQTATSRRILVIDHDDTVRGVLCDRLKALGFEVAAEGDGMSALSRVADGQETAPFHGALVELQVPGPGGMAVLQEIQERFPMIPVIVMSDSIHVGRLRQAVQAGAKEYLVKPFDPELFRRKCVSVFLDGKDQTM
jgi:CheY-like chemotaxis protein